MMKKIVFIAGIVCFLQCSYAQVQWPAITKTTKPWTRWWWMGSAVDEKNLSTVITAYSGAGFGGVEVTPIYGAIGFEKRYIPFLSPQWMHMLNFAIAKANAAGMGVDMNAGTGWPFGGPQVTYEDAASKLIIQTYSLEAGKSFDEKIIVKDEKQLKANAQLQAAIAYGEKGEIVSLLDKIDNTGTLNWTPPAGKWDLYAVFSGKTLQMVKRSAPGGEGLVMNHLNKKAVNNYFKRFDSAFNNKAPGIRAFFNDSYEVYNANWSPDLLAEFKKRRGYDLSLYIKQLQSADVSENATRIKSDYRETMSQMLIDNLGVNWTNWAHKNSRITKYQAHGSPGNLLDLYATADIPECEAYFGLTYFAIPGLRHDTTDVVNPGSNPNIFKFASSAANVFGKRLTSSETLVWLTDHFKTSLSQCKPEVERLFLGGINHVFYHGTTYSPEDVPFPGWQFYASSNFTPSNSLWSQLPGLNTYVTRCQSVLQSGKADNELLIYWPVYDCWANPKGTDMQLTIHNAQEWLTPTDFNKTVTQLQNTGYSLDYISDKMLTQAQVKNESVQVVADAPAHKALIIPGCNLMPAETLNRIIQLATSGATVIFQGFPADVPGFYNVEERRKKLMQLIASIKLIDKGNNISEAKSGKGRIIVSKDLQKALEYVNIQREPLVDAGLQFVRRAVNGGKYYYIVNHTANEVNTMLPIRFVANTVTILDPQTGATGTARFVKKQQTTDVQLQLKPGQAIILKASVNKETGSPWKYIESPGKGIVLNGEWTLHFKEGGPQIPADKKMAVLQPWTLFTDDSTTQSFSGTGVYSTEFNITSKSSAGYLLQLGKVYESAKVFINDKEVGILWSIPFEAEVGKYLKVGKNTIKIEVANLMANRIRNMDRNKQEWRRFHEINFVNINYKRFDATNWEVQPSGLEGPVTITALNKAMPRVGIIAPLEQDSLIYSSGFRVLGESVGKTLSPSFTEEQFQQNLARIKNAKCKVFLCNIFFPGSLKIAGPAVNESRVLGYADTVLSRAKRAGIPFIILGSGGARRLPEGYDTKKAMADFAILCRKLAVIAHKYEIMIALESLEVTETNFLVTLTSAAEVVRAVNHPNFKLNADIFHMMREGESPESIVKAGDLLVHCEIAEKLRRSLPGVLGDDFKPYLRALRKAKYTGYIFIEGNTNNPGNDIPLSFKSLTRQLEEVYAE